MGRDGGAAKLVIGADSPGEVILSNDAKLKSFEATLCIDGGQGSVVVNSGASWQDIGQIDVGAGVGNGGDVATSLVTISGQDANGNASNLAADAITVGDLAKGQLVLDNNASATVLGLLWVGDSPGAAVSEVDILPGAQLTSGSASIRGATGDPTVPGALVYINAGTWTTTDASMPFQYGDPAGGGATIKFDSVNGGTINAAGTVEKVPGGNVEGNGWIQGNFMSNGGPGHIAPGNGPTGLGAITVGGNLDVSAGVEFDALLGSPGVNSLLQTSGNATLGGNFYATSVVGANTYMADYFDGEYLEWGVRFQVLSAASITGEFANLPAGYYAGGSALPQLPSGYCWYVSYQAQTLTLTVMPPMKAYGEQIGVTPGPVSDVGNLLFSVEPLTTCQIVTQPQYGTVTVDPTTGVFTYTDTNTTETDVVDTFTYTCTGGVTSNLASVQIYIEGEGPTGTVEPPIATAFDEISVPTPEAQPLVVNATDFDDLLNLGFSQDGDPLTAALVAGQGPAHATSFSLNPDGSFSYTPQPGFVGEDWFTYQLSDGGDEQSSYATALIDVMPPLTPNQPGDPGFETPALGSGASAFDPGGTDWEFSGTAGITGNGSAPSAQNPNAPEGTQVGFLEDANSTMAQTVSMSAGTYQLSFDAAQRANLQSGGQDFQVLVDGFTVGQFTPTSTSYSPYSTEPFTVPAGNHAIAFLGVDTAGGDNTAFIDNVRIGLPTTTTLTLASGASPSNATQALSFTATVGGGVPDGEAMTLEDASNNNAVVASGTLSGGSATLTVPAGTLRAGTHNLVAVYNGDSNYAAGQSAPLSHTIQVVVTNVQLNGNLPGLVGAQGSMVDSIVYTFSEPVNVAAANAFSIDVNSAYSIGTVPTLNWTALAPNPDGSSTQWVITFSGAGVVGGSIANGVYDITLNAAAVTSDYNPAVASQPRATDTFFRLFGDINGDGVVNAADNIQFKAALATYNPAFDYNADGVINAADNFQFKNSQSISFSNDGIVYTI